MSKAWAKGSTRAWRRIRAHVLARDAGQGCRAHHDGWCDRVPGQHTCTDIAEVAHHTHGRTITGDDPRFIVAACTACNLHIGDPTQHEDPPNKAVTRW